MKSRTGLEPQISGRAWDFMVFDKDSRLVIPGMLSFFCSWYDNKFQGMSREKCSIQVPGDLGIRVGVFGNLNRKAQRSLLL